MKKKCSTLLVLLVLLSSFRNSTIQTTPAWSNPVMNLVGQNIATYVKALYKVGDLKTMRKFIVSKDLKSISEIELNKILNDCHWGYDFKMKNCTWTSKREFYLTMETNKMNTIGVENYYGIVFKDTARLIINKQNPSNPFAK